MYVELVPEATVDPSKAWRSRKAFQGLKISPQAWGIHSTKKINDMGCDQLVGIRPSTYVAKRAKRQDNSILLRHMDDVVGTAPEKHLMGDVEHM